MALNQLDFSHDSGGRTDLSNIGDVAAVVASFVALTTNAYHDYGQGGITREAALAKIDAEAARLGRAFMGQDPAYYTTDWNAAHRLGAHIRAQDSVQFKHPNQDPGEAFFQWLAAQVVQAANDLQTGTAAEQVGPQLQGTIRSAVRFLLTGEG